MRYKVVAFGLVSSLILVGCGGSGTSSTGGVSAFVGTYQTSFTRATDTVMFLKVNSSGSVDILIDDAAGTSNPYTGTGTVQANGTFTGTASQARAPINVSGTFSMVLGSPTFNGSLTGGMTASGLTGGRTTDYSTVVGTYSFTATGGPNSSVGTTTGTITFTSGGTWTLTGTNRFGDQWTTGGSMTALGAATSSGNYQFGQNQGSMKISCPGAFRFNSARTGGTARISVFPQPTGVETIYNMTLTLASAG